MDYSAFKVPYLAENQIKQQADLIRNKYWDKTIPVDIEKIIEINLGLSVIPLPGLHKNFGFDAFISSDWSYVYVDNDRYFDDTHYKRVRFSLAHELGHLIDYQTKRKGHPFFTPEKAALLGNEMMAWEIADYITSPEIVDNYFTKRNSL